jgi:hypothetical protein
MTERFEVTEKLKKNLYYMIGAGVLGMILAFAMYPDNNHSRFWSNILLNAYFFTGIGIFGIFFAAANQLGYSGWIATVKRIYMSLSGFIKIGAVFALILVGGVWMHYHNLYDHWALKANADELDITKQIFFNPTFWSIRILIYFALWIFVGARVIKAINAGNINEQKAYKRSKLFAALWIVIFAVTESFVSWDMVMSTDPHWYSTLFGWYNFASYGCAAFAMAIILTVYLKSKGYLAQVNINHIHDMGKFMFGLSVFWTYLWFSQFMLQWYGNIPEDTHYWVKRFDIPYFKVTIFLALILNFVAPLLIFIRRGAKRNVKVAVFVAVLVIIGHYIDFFNMIMYEPNVKICACAKPEGEGKKEALLKVGTALYAENKSTSESVIAKATTDAVITSEKAEAKEVVKAGEGKAESKAEEAKEGAKEGEHGEKKEGEEGGCEGGVCTIAGIGIAEILIFVGFLGAFLLMFFNELSKDTLINPNDPYLKESLKHHVEYS